MGKINKHILVEWSILLFALFPLIPNNFKWLPVALLSVSSLFCFKRHKYNFKWFIINASLYIVYVISLIYTSNLFFAFKKLSTALSLLILPLVFFVFLHGNIIRETLRKRFLKLFIASSTFFSIIIFIYILFDTSTVFYKNFYSNRFRILVEKAPLIGEHPIYASVFLALALIMSMYIYNNQNNKIKIMVIISIIFNMLLLIMLSSKGVILSLIFIVFTLLLKRLLKNKNKFRVLMLLASVVLITSLLFHFNRRMGEILKTSTYTQVNSNYSNSFRIGIYKCATTVIKKSVIFGYGVGDAQDVLNDCYKSKSSLLLEKTYNSHNQFLDIWIKTGIFGLLIFISFLFLNFRKALKKRDYLYSIILLFYILNFMIENILVRQSGVILFSFLINFYSFKNIKVSNNKN